MVDRDLEIPSVNFQVGSNIDVWIFSHEIISILNNGLRLQRVFK